MTNLSRTSILSNAKWLALGFIRISAPFRAREAPGRLATQAPDIDASVFLTDCDPSGFRPGDFTDVEIVGSREYDLIGRPVL